MSRLHVASSFRRMTRRLSNDVNRVPKTGNGKEVGTGTGTGAFLEKTLERTAIPGTHEIIVEVR